MRLCNSRLPEEHFVCYQTSQRNWVIIKVHYRYLRKCLWSWHGSRLGFVTPTIGGYLWALSVIQHHGSLASTVTKELVTRWRITEWVKRLASNEIELGIEIPTIESRASNIPPDKGNNVCCHMRFTDKDLCGICRNQYEHPGSAVGYWPESRLGHVYIIPEPVGSAHLRFDDVIVLYELCDWWPNVVRSPGWDHGHDKESRMTSRTWRGVPEWSRGKYWYIGRWYSDNEKVSECTG